MVCVCKFCCQYYAWRIGLLNRPPPRPTRFVSLRAKRDEKANRNGSRATLSSSAADDVSDEMLVLTISKLLSLCADVDDDGLWAVDAVAAKQEIGMDDIDVDEGQCTAVLTAATKEYTVDDWDDSWAEASDTVAAKKETADTDDDTRAVQPPPQPPPPPPTRPPPLPSPPPPPPQPPSLSRHILDHPSI